MPLKLSNNILLILLMSLLLCKIIVFLMVKENLLTISFGGSNDSEYYHNYAIGLIDNAPNIWPLLLRQLNSISLYSRNIVSYCLFLLNLIFIPILFVKIVGLNLYTQQKMCLYAIIVCIFYPSLFYYTFDIYRDVFMVFTFLFSCLFVKKFIVNKNILIKSIYLALLFIGCYLLYKMRPYLGFSFFISLFICKIKLDKIRIFFILCFYLIILFIINYFNGFHSLLSYRSLFIEGESGSFIPLDFSSNMFLTDYILSVFYQLFGVYIFDLKSLFVFVSESIIFIYMLLYVVLNIKYADKFVVFLLKFFVLYASIWTIANANLGTAIRLRIFNYFSIYLCYFYILYAKFKKENLNKCNSP